MLDPVPPPPPWLSKLTAPYASALTLPTLPFHIHEVLFSYILYQSLQFASPHLSNYFFPNVYTRLNRRTRINWDVHVVSLVQSCLINGLALWVMWTDEERQGMKNSVVERVYGYTGASGLIQAFAAGYFIWDLIVSTRHIGIFGLGIWAHAVSALCVFSFGFRPFVNYYGPVFILYELSTPFLNVHWFCDKLNMTGGNLQFYNGITLLVTFFCSRLVWGTWQSTKVFRDIWEVLQMGPTVPEFTDVARSSMESIFVPRNGEICMGKESCLIGQSEVMKFAHSGTPAVPMWLAATYLASNIVLHSLNFYWFSRMIETVRKRFEPKPDDKLKQEKQERERRQSIIEELADGLDENELSGPKTPRVEKSEAMSTGVDGAAQRRAVKQES